MFGKFSLFSLKKIPILRMWECMTSQKGSIIGYYKINSEFAICHIVQHGNVSGRRKQSGSIIGLVTIEGFRMEFMLPWRTTWQIANSLIIQYNLKEQGSTRPSSDQRWNMPALHGLVLLLPHCHSWMLSKGVLSGSLTFLRMTSSLTKFSHWEPEEKLEPSHCSTVCIMERPRNCFVSCFLNIFSWIPVLDALLDRMT